MGDFNVAKQVQALRLDLSPAEGNAFRACVLSSVKDQSVMLVPVKDGFHYHLLDLVVDNRGGVAVCVQIYDNSSTISNMIVSATVPSKDTLILNASREGKPFRANCPVVYVTDKAAEVVVTALGYYEGN